MSHTPKPLPQPWHDLAQSLNGIAAVAALFSVHRTTLWRWANQEVPMPGPARELAAILFRRAGLSARILPGNPWQIPTEKDLDEQVHRVMGHNEKPADQVGVRV